MRIVPKYQKPSSGIRYTSPNEGGKNWRTMIFNPYRQHILDTLSQYGEADDYGSWLNEMQSRHAGLYNAAGGAGGNWQNVAFTSPEVGQYLHDYRGDQRFGKVALPSDYKYDFNQTGIQNGQNNNRYDFFGNLQRIEKDRGNNKYTVDNLYSAITDDRRLLGRKEDWDENSDDFKNWQSELNKRGWETYLDSDNYYKLRRLPGSGNPNDPNNPNNPNNPNGPNGSVPALTRNRYGLDPNKFKNLGPLFLTGLLSTGRLLGTLKTNSKVYGEQLKGIRPNLLQGFETHQRIHGDEGTRQQYYRRAAAGESQAARAMTSDAVRLYAQLQEAKRIGDELRAQGDLIDNQMIRQTGQLSKAEEDANTERRTLVVNYNNTEINRANKDYHDLLAAKHAANWTSKDNFLQGIEHRLRQRAEMDRAYQRQLDALDALYKMQNDEEYLKLYNDYSKAWDTAAEKYDNDINKMNADPEFKKAKQAFLNKQYQLKRQQIEGLRRNRSNWSIFAKKGTTLTFKTKDDLLYKTARDAVDHFRKMVKMTSDATIASRSKPIKLKGVPKSTIKMLTGGVAPFVIYKPVALGGEQGVSTNIDPTVGRQGSGNGGSDKKLDTPLDVIKDLFKDVKGLPSDVNTVLSSMTAFLAKSEAFGNELSTDDIASLYLKLLLKLNNIKFSKENFDKAKEVATNKDALGEFAVDESGRIIVQEEDGNLKRITVSEYKNNREKYNPLTNNYILNLRAYTKDMAFQDTLLNVVNNGIGMSKIGEHIKSILPTLDKTKLTEEGFTKKLAQDIQSGIEVLLNASQRDLALAPDGTYIGKYETESKAKLAELALNYIMGILPKNMKTVLEMRAIDQGTTSKNLVAMLVGSGVGSTTSITWDTYNEKTGTRGSSKSGGGDEDAEGVKSNPIMQMLQELGGTPRTWELITRDSGTRMSVNGTYYSAIPKVTDDMSIDSMLSTSGIQGILDSKQGITFGDLRISPDLLKDIMYSNSGGMVVTLPCKIVNGHKEVNLGIKDTYESAVNEVESQGLTKNSPEYSKVLGQKLKEKGLTSLLKSDGTIDRNKFGQFLVVEAYATSKVKGIDKSSKYVEKVSNPDKALEDRMIRALSTNDKKDNYELDIDYLLWGDDVYRGSVFIPLTLNINASINAWGDKVKVEEAREIENKYLNFNKASKMKSSQSNVL